MGLFINQTEHQEMFKNRREIQASNQNISTIDPLAEFMLEQERAYASLREYNQILKNLVEHQNKIQEKESKKIHNRLNQLKSSNIQHQAFEDEVLEKMSIVDEKIDSANTANKTLTNYLKTIQLSNDELVQKITEQLDAQETIQKVQSTRLENQENSLEKVVRQLDYLRSLVYERAHFLIDKVMKDSKQPSHLQVRNKKQKRSLE